MFKMAFIYGVKLTGFKEKKWINELPSKLYRDLVKSLYNVDDTAFLLHLNNVIEHICPGILHEGLNVIDKVILLLNMRAICISPNLALEGECPVTKKKFKKEIMLEDIISKAEKVTYENTISHENIQVTHTVIKARDEIAFIDLAPDLAFTYQLASCIDSIVINQKTLYFKDFSLEERLKIVETMPLVITKKVYESILATEERIVETKLLTVMSPYALNAPVVDLPVSTSPAVSLQFCKLLFNDDLNNLYKINFCLVNKGNFSAEYADSITPAEQTVYWTYYMEQASKEKEAYEKGNKSGNEPTFGGPKLASNKITSSEFT